jgi:hypothetical protein
MIARRDDIHARVEKLVRRIDGDARAACGIFAIGDDNIHAMLGAQFWEDLPHGVSPRLANDITNEKQFHHDRISRRYFEASLGRARSAASDSGQLHGSWLNTACDPRIPKLIAANPGVQRRASDRPRLAELRGIFPRQLRREIPARRHPQRLS